tara:strand:- start:876 stop:1097 length:222 start_codon:yes stop_codon:yes gene_type:complete
MRLANMDAGKALRVLMAENLVSAIQLGFDLGLSSTTVSTLRREKLVSGKNLVMLSDYFKLSASDFIRKGEEEA